MTQAPEQSPEDLALLEAAKEAEQKALDTALTQHLHNRVVALNVEVRRRDARILELEQALADLEDSARERADAVQENGS